MITGNVSLPKLIVIGSVYIHSYVKARICPAKMTASWQNKQIGYLGELIKYLKLIAIIVLHHLLDFSYKVCHCCRNLQLLSSTFKQKGEHMYGS